VHTASEGSFPALVQERVEGHGVGVFVLLWDGGLQGVVGHRRIREKPPSGGVSVVRDSTIVEPGLLRQSLDLLEELQWERGVAMVEYRVEPESGRTWLMEINGRFWGSLQMAIDAGVDFPALLLSCCEGNTAQEAVIGRPGVRTRWLLGDVDHLLARIVKPRAALNVPTSFPGRGRAILDFLRDFGPGVRLEVLRLSDPRPFLTEAGAWVRSLGSERLGVGRSRGNRV
jgi:predicted ATP-grasp superfamily ATP-dependent carboligase